MDIQFIKELMKEFKKCELTKLEIKSEEFEIKLENKKEIVSAPVAAPVVAHAPVQPVAATVATTNSHTPEVKKEVEGHKIVSPMVGTVYIAPGPDAKPFVAVGQRVKKGDVVCIIEAMKLMNEVEADADGEVVEILITNEQMVQFGEPLFTIR